MDSAGRIPLGLNEQTRMACAADTHEDLESHRN
jgi:hypothetical protein